MINPLAADLDHILAQTVGLWDGLRGQRIFITGGTGFFGCWLLESLAWANDELGLDATAVALTRNPAAFRDKAPHLATHPAIHLYPGDVRSFELLTQSFDFIIHAAAPVDPKELNADRFRASEIITEGTLRVLKQSVQSKVGRFLFISSGAVYGAQPPDLPRLAETYGGGPDIANPLGAYGEAKRYAEILCTLFHQTAGVRTIVARPFTFVGPFQDIDSGFAVTQFIRCGLRKEAIHIQGDGTPLRSYCSGADLASALWKILLSGEPGRAYNVGAEEEISILELARKIVNLIGVELEIKVAKDPIIGQKPARYIPDITRLRSELGFSPLIGLDEALARTIAWARENLANGLGN